jgi:hypothetical protein
LSKISNLGGVPDLLGNSKGNSESKTSKISTITTYFRIDYYGYEIEPFNMRTERDIGSFDKGGFFVFNK